ncbi:hypothetical protein BGW36DRAFT_433044 [Talaromyces proteolyticus]|uniref:PIN domain-containing protein n=1 Tax=Talaromyces proteolyticus TaxID=1131652 RepID=A0AAD4KF07_9EURO|nr:uncharacterized protein BGW36DRAFT_433044 [Talaromyces proteolyticus]KAH8690089.1 hypothetical protein BGW36DRAFT_433044 [Talaromyces proteolyticus]
MSAGRKVFHCAVDDTVLTTNISEIKRWASNGAITLFVPLYTLDRLQTPKRGASQAAINSREAVRFLDRVTSGKDNIPSDRVVLQGPMEQYETWTEAEQFFLPEFEDPIDESYEIPDGEVATPKIEVETKFNGITKESPKGPGLPGLPSDLSQMLLSKLNFKEPQPVANIHNDMKSSVSLPSTGTQSDQGSRASSRSSRTSPEYADRNGSKPANGHHRSVSSSSTIQPTPTSLRPLLSSLLWRLHCDKEASAAALGLTLVTNDRDTQIWAQKFGIMTKNIHQLRTSIQYEEKEFKNRVKYAEKAQHVTPDPKPLFTYENDSEEDELVFVPRGRGKGASRSAGGRGGSGRKARAAAAAAATAAQPEAPVEVPSQPIDPDSFSRSLGPNSAKRSGVDLSTQSGAARGLAASGRRHGGGRRAGGSRPHSSRGGRGQGKLWVP